MTCLTITNVKKIFHFVSEEWGLDPAEWRKAIAEALRKRLFYAVNREKESCQ